MASKERRFGSGVSAGDPPGASPGASRTAAETEPPLDGPSDDEAIARARAGDHDAFRVLVERYQQRAFRLALRVLRDEEAARDAVQEAFLKVYASLARFEGRSSFYTWLYRVVLNLCLDLKRRDRSARHVEWNDEVAGGAGAEADTDETFDGAPPSPQNALERAELREHMVAAIADLPDAARSTLLLREVDGLSYEEISRALDIPKGTVMSRLHYARKRIQKALIAAGLVASVDEPSGRTERRGDEPEEGSDA